MRLRGTLQLAGFSGHFGRSWSVLEMADHGFDGGATAHRATDGFGDPADLAADPDLEPVGIVVAAIALVAVFGCCSSANGCVLT
jgi:hypothetical protein